MDKRMDMPLDYQRLWANLRIRVQDLAADQASRAAVEKDMDAIRRCQGAYAFLHNILSEMENLIKEARADKGTPLSEDTSDNFS